MFTINKVIKLTRLRWTNMCGECISETHWKSKSIRKSY